ncbi:hypothetical protein SAMN05216391_13611 [Lachnospiraceae bacterium KHCPX20]|nr:hypothetical protein SAMN05216391_13611 [Lachnospiraceae bacterium KHCPX20]
MNEKKTEELNQILQEVKLSGLPEYMKENRSCMKDAKRSFYYYMKDLLDQKGIRLKDVYMMADVSESYGGQIIRMNEHTQNRDLIIRLCVAAHCNWQEMNRALKLYGFNELYAKNSRDACIIVALNERIFDPARLDEILMEHHFEPLKGQHE